MTEPQFDLGGLAVSAETATPKKVTDRLTPRRLAVIFVAVLAGSVGGTLIATSVINNNSSATNAMGSWMGSYGTTYLAVSHDVAAVSTDANAQSPMVATVRADCAKLETDVSQGQDDPPMPLEALQTQWSSILSNLSKGAHDCLNGIDQRDPNLLNQTQTDFTNAATAYVKLIQAVQRVQG